MINNIKIQLIGNVTGYLDLKEDTDFPLNLNIADIRDITKRKGTTSKTIKLAGSKNNNKLLNQYFDVNVVDGTFNINTLQKCIVLENNIPIMENAYIQLMNVRKVQTTNRHDQLVEYEVFIKDNVADFFTKISDAELTDLNFDGYDHTYNSTNVINTFNNTSDDTYKYVMPTCNTGNVYSLTEWLPGIYAKAYWDRIFSNAGFTYKWSSMSDDDIRFDKLIIPYNGDVPKITAEEQEEFKVIADISAGPIPIAFTPPIGENVSFSDDIILDNEIQDDHTDYDPVTGEYTNFQYLAVGTTLNFSFDIDYDLYLINNSAGTAYLQQTTGVPSFTGGYKYTPKLYIYKNGSQQTSINFNPSSPTTNVFEGTSIAVSSQLNIKNGVHTVTGGINNLVPGDIITLRVGWIVQQVNNSFQVRWKSAASGGSLVNVEVELSINNIQMTILPNVDSVQFDTNINLNKFVPNKIKQKDFIKSIIQMYNLYIDIDKAKPNELVIQTRDAYYDSGSIVNWTKKLNKEKDQLLQFLPELTSKKITLTYKKDADIPNVGYFDNIKEIYGQQDFTFDNEYIKGEEIKELIFSPTPIRNTEFGAIAPLINGAAPKNNIRILYDGGVFTCDEYDILDYGTTGNSPSEYPLFSHFDLPDNPTFDINFGICDYYFYNVGTLTNNNLYNLHWRRTLNQINENKILTAYFDLNGADISRLRLNDKIRIDNSYWNINKIIDYNPTKPGPTKVELLAIDDELKLAPFKTKRPVLTAAEDTLIRDIWKFERERLDVNNGIATVADVTGIGNVVGSDGNGSIVKGDNNNVNTKNSIILGDNNKSTDAVENVLVVGNDIEVTEDNTIYTENLVVSGSMNGVDINKLLNTNVINGPGVSINAGDNTKFDIKVKGQIIDPDTTEIFDIDIDLTAQTVTNLLTNKVTYLAIDESGTVLQQTSPFTNDQLKNKLGEWVLVHSNLTNLNAVNNYPERGYSLAKQLHSMMRNRGIRNIQGNVVTANGVNQSINVSAGVLERVGVNPDDTNIGNPNELSVASLTAPTLRMRTQGTYESADTVSIDTTNYDNGSGSPVAIPAASNFVIHRIAKFTSNLIRVQYGQNIYANMADALANLNSETYNVEPNIAENGLIIAYLIVRKNTTDLSDVTRAKFVQAARDGSVNASLVPTLQNSYDVSIPNPEIMTNVTNGAVTFRNGSGSDTNATQNWQNNAGTDVVTILGNGDISCQNITLASTKVIKSANGGGQIDLDYFGDPDTILISNDSGGFTKSLVYLSDEFLGSYLELSSYTGNIYSFANTNTTFETNNSQLFISDTVTVLINDNSGSKIFLGKLFGENLGQLQSNDVVRVGIDSIAKEIYIADNTSVSRTSNAGDTFATIIATNNGTMGAGVINSVIIGGLDHSIILNDQSIIGGGFNNTIIRTTLSSNNNAILGGSNNDILECANSGIIAGNNNNITASISNKIYNFIGGGEDNSISNTIGSVIVGGDTNIIDDSDLSFIAGGLNNSILDESKYCAIIGGDTNIIDGNGVLNNWSGIFAGRLNTILGNSNMSSIINGNGNTIDNSDNSTIIASTSSTINGNGIVLLGVVSTTATKIATTYTRNMDINGDIENHNTHTVSTTNATATTINTFATTSEVVYQLEYNIIGKLADTSKGIVIKMLGSFRNDGGTITQIGTTSLTTHSDFTTATAQFTISGTNVLAQVVGEAATNIDWSASLIYRQL